jgi:membrane dipeptidase
MPDPEQVHRSAIILDAHADTPQRFLDEQWNFSDPLGHGMLNLPTARAGNLAGQIFAIWVEPTQHRNHYAQRALALIQSVHQQVDQHPNDLTLCLTAADIRQAHAQGKFAILLSLEGGHAIENSLTLLRQYHSLGVRSVTLTWANSNQWADSSGDIDDDAIPHHNGLTPFGRQVIAEMNALGILIDVSHVSDKTFADVLALTRAPIVASHSNARALTHSPRNLTDDMLRALAANHGLAMVNFYPAFLDESWRQAWNAQRPARQAAQSALAAQYPNQPIPFHASNAIERHFAAQLPRPPVQSLIRHILHIIEVAGIDHIGLGSDFDGISALPEGIDSAADLPKITAALLAEGLTPQDLHKLLGANLLRVLEQVESTAHSPSRPLSDP